MSVLSVARSWTGDRPSSFYLLLVCWLRTMHIGWVTVSPTPGAGGGAPSCETRPVSVDSTLCGAGLLLLVSSIQSGGQSRPRCRLINRQSTVHTGYGPSQRQITPAPGKSQEVGPFCEDDGGSR
eukprot:3458738-Prymnesium_polylepis.1